MSPGKRKYATKWKFFVNEYPVFWRTVTCRLDLKRLVTVPDRLDRLDPFFSIRMTRTTKQSNRLNWLFFFFLVTKYSVGIDPGVDMTYRRVYPYSTSQSRNSMLDGKDYQRAHPLEDQSDPVKIDGIDERYAKSRLWMKMSQGRCGRGMRNVLCACQWAEK